MSARSLPALALLPLLGGCAGFSHVPLWHTQHAPEPMESRSPLPPGDARAYAPGPEEVRVLRHADPVQVRPAGRSASYPLSFYRKDQRLSSGSGVFSAPGGRAEVLWSGGNSLVLYGESSGIVGSHSRGEPAFVLRQVERVLIDFRNEDQVELLGGALLRVHSGPFLVERVRGAILRVKNQSKSSGQVSFRDEVIRLDPGQAVDLPLLSAGSAPERGAGDFTLHAAPGASVLHAGDVDVSPHPDGVRLRGRGEHEVRAFGVRLRLPPGGEALLSLPAAPPAGP